MSSSTEPASDDVKWLSLATDTAIISQTDCASQRRTLVRVMGSDTICFDLRVRSAWYEFQRCVASVVAARAGLEAAAARTASGRAGLSSRGGSRVLYRHTVGSNFRAVLAPKRHSVLRVDDRPATALVALHRRRVPGPCCGGARRRDDRAGVGGGIRHELHGGAAERLRGTPFRGCAAMVR